jgi:hypothetical protein
MISRGRPAHCWVCCPQARRSVRTAFKTLRQFARIQTRFRNLKMSSVIFSSLNVKRQIFVSWAEYIRYKLITRGVERKRQRDQLAETLGRMGHAAKTRKTAKARYGRAVVHSSRRREGMAWATWRAGLWERKRVRAVVRGVQLMIQRRYTRAWAHKAAQHALFENKRSMLRHAVRRWRARSIKHKRFKPKTALLQHQYLKAAWKLFMLHVKAAGSRQGLMKEGKESWKATATARAFQSWSQRCQALRSFKSSRDLAVQHRVANRSVRSLRDWAAKTSQRRQRRQKAKAGADLVLRTRGAAALRLWAQRVQSRRDHADRAAESKRMYCQRVLGQALFEWAQTARGRGGAKRWMLLAKKAFRKRHLRAAFRYLHLWAEDHRERGRMRKEALVHSQGTRVLTSLRAWAEAVKRRRTQAEDRGAAARLHQRWCCHSAVARLAAHRIRRKIAKRQAQEKARALGRWRKAVAVRYLVAHMASRRARRHGLITAEHRGEALAARRYLRMWLAVVAERRAQRRDDAARGHAMEVWMGKALLRRWHQTADLWRGQASQEVKGERFERRRALKLAWSTWRVASRGSRIVRAADSRAQRFVHTVKLRADLRRWRVATRASRRSRLVFSVGADYHEHRQERVFASSLDRWRFNLRIKRAIRYLTRQSCARQENLSQFSDGCACCGF